MKKIYKHAVSLCFSYKYFKSVLMKLDLQAADVTLTFLFFSD